MKSAAGESERSESLERSEARRATAQLTYADAEDSWAKVRLIRAIEVATGRSQLERIYRALKQESVAVETFFHGALQLGRITIDQDGLAVGKIPTDGPLVLVANHPFGLIDGLMLCDLAMRSRGSFQILLNSRLCKDADLVPYFLPIDFNETRAAVATNIATKRTALETLKNNGTLVIFPGGGVATAPLRGGRAKEFPWTTFAAKLVHQSRATVLPVYFHGQNSRWFDVASALGDTVRIAVLLFEARNKLGKTLRMTVGEPLSYDRLKGYNRRSELTEFLRRKTLELEHTPTAAVFDAEELR